jgi:hypothetical protein
MTVAVRIPAIIPPLAIAIRVDGGDGSLLSLQVPRARPKPFRQSLLLSLLLPSLAGFVDRLRTQNAVAFG